MGRWKVYLAHSTGCIYHHSTLRSRLTWLVSLIALHKNSWKPCGRGINEVLKGGPEVSSKETGWGCALHWSFQGIKWWMRKVKSGYHLNNDIVMTVPTMFGDQWLDNPCPWSIGRAGWKVGCKRRRKGRCKDRRLMLLGTNAQPVHDIFKSTLENQHFYC